MPARDDTARRDPELVVLASELLDELEELSERMATHIQDRVELYLDSSTVSTEELRRSCRANVEFVLHRFVDDGPVDNGSVDNGSVDNGSVDNGGLDVEPAEVTGRRRAAQGVPLPSVMAAYRVGFSYLWKTIVDRSHQRQLVSNEALVGVASEIWEAHDTFADAMASAYRDAMLAEALRGAQERSALVQALLEGRIVDEATIWDVADALRLPSRGPFVVVAAEAAQVAQEALRGAEARLRAKDIGSAWRLLPDLQIGIARLRDSKQVPVLADTLRQLARGRVGISPPYLALSETARALRFARIALAGSPSGVPQVTVFDEFPLAVAAVSAPDAMERVAHIVLGPVLELSPDDQAILLETLAAWRDNGGSATETARQIFCHPNTVRHRLRRIEERTGRSLGDPRSAAELLLALEAVRLLPPVT